MEGIRRFQMSYSDADLERLSRRERFPLPCWFRLWTMKARRTRPVSRDCSVFSVNLEPNEQVLPVANEKEITEKLAWARISLEHPMETCDGRFRTDGKNGAARADRKPAKTRRQTGFSVQVFPASLQEGRTEVRAVLDAGAKTDSEGYTLVTRKTWALPTTINRRRNM